MKNKFFFVIFFHDAFLKALLDTMRLIADSNQKNFSHITVKGPYRTNQKKQLLIDNEEIVGTSIKITGAGNFFADKQNTVFLKCEDNKNLYNIWKKKEERTFKHFHPHITIYDGKDNTYAKELFHTIYSYKINLDFIVDRLEMYSSRDKEKIFDLKNQVDYNFLSSIAGIQIDQHTIDNLPNSQRLYIIGKLCKKLQEGVNKRQKLIQYHYNKENISVPVEA